MSGAAAGRGYREPEGSAGNFCRGKGSKSLLPALLQNLHRLFSWGLRIFPRIFTRASGVITTIWELNWEKKTAEKECLGNTGLKALLSFCNVQIDVCGFIYSITSK